MAQSLSSKKKVAVPGPVTNRLTWSARCLHDLSRMGAETLMTWLVCLLLGALLYPVIRLDAHWGGWLVGMDNLQARAQTGYGIPADVHAFTLQTMTDSHAMAVDVHRDVEIAGGTENMARQVLRELRDRLPSILTDVQRTSSKMPDLVSHGVQLEDWFRTPATSWRPSLKSSPSPRMS